MRNTRKAKCVQKMHMYKASFKSTSGFFLHTQCLLLQVYDSFITERCKNKGHCRTAQPGACGGYVLHPRAYMHEQL